MFWLVYLITESSTYNPIDDTCTLSLGQELLKKRENDHENRGEGKEESGGLLLGQAMYSQRYLKHSDYIHYFSTPLLHFIQGVHII